MLVSLHVGLSVSGVPVCIVGIHGIESAAATTPVLQKHLVRKTTVHVDKFIQNNFRYLYNGQGTNIEPMLKHCIKYIYNQIVEYYIVTTDIILHVY